MIEYQSNTYHGCSLVHEAYSIIGKIGEGTFGEVYRARQKSTGKEVALKKILLHSEKEGFPLTALREIRILKLLRHKNIIPLLDLAIERSNQASKNRGSVHMVTPYMDHDLSGLLGNKNISLSTSHIKCYMLQLLEGISYLHKKKFLHRDIKAANILVNNEGILKLADFGLARGYYGPIPTAISAGKGTENLTAMVVTRWYRPPELILGERKYTTAIDMWGIGCVFGEMFFRKPIFPGNSDIDQGVKIFHAIGCPTEETMPGWSVLPGAQNKKAWNNDPTCKLNKMFSWLTPDALDFLTGLLKLDPIRRTTALGALQHAYFKTNPLPCQPHELPFFQSSHELDNQKRRDREQKDREMRERGLRDKETRIRADPRRNARSRDCDSRDFKEKNHTYLPHKDLNGPIDRKKQSRNFSPSPNKLHTNHVDSKISNSDDFSRNRPDNRFTSYEKPQNDSVNEILAPKRPRESFTPIKKDTFAPPLPKEQAPPPPNYHPSSSRTRGINSRPLWRSHANNDERQNRDHYDRYDRYDRYNRYDRYDRYDRSHRADRYDRLDYSDRYSDDKKRNDSYDKLSTSLASRFNPRREEEAQRKRSKPN